MSVIAGNAKPTHRASMTNIVPRLHNVDMMLNGAKYALNIWSKIHIVLIAAEMLQR